MSMFNSRHSVVSPRVFIEADQEFATDLLQNLASFEFSDDEKKVNEIKIKVNDPYGKFVDDPRFAAGVRFRVAFGYPNDMSRVYSVVIAKAKPSMPASGMRTIEMVAYDARYDMGKGSNPRNWGAVSSSEVARQIAKRYRFDTDIEESGDGRGKARIQPASMTDISYLQSLAAPLNWDCYVEETVLHFHKKRYDAPPGLTFTYFTDLLGSTFSFSPEVSMSKPSASGKAGANPKDNKSKVRSAGPKDTGTAGAGLYVLTTDTTSGTNIVVNSKVVMAPKQPLTTATPETDKKVIKKHAAATMGKIDMKAVKASLTVAGTPRLVSKMMIRLENVGLTYSGNWRVVSTRHKIDSSGYVVEASLTRNALNKGKNKDKNSKGNDKTSKGVLEALLDFLSGHHVTEAKPARVILNTDTNGTTIRVTAKVG